MRQRDSRRSSLSTLFEIRGRQWFVLALLFIVGALGTWIALH